jgi:hypothetical protein
MCQKRASESSPGRQWTRLLPEVELMLDEEHVRTNEDDWFKSTNAELAAPCSDLQLLRLFERNEMPKTRFVDAMHCTGERFFLTFFTGIAEKK